MLTKLIFMVFFSDFINLFCFFLFYRNSGRNSDPVHPSEGCNGSPASVTPQHELSSPTSAPNPTSPNHDPPDEGEYHNNNNNN